MARKQTYSPSGTGTFLSAFGGLGFAGGVIAVVVAFVREAPAVEGAFTFGLGASICGGALVLIGLGAIVERLDYLCHCARLGLPKEPEQPVQAPVTDKRMPRAAEPPAAYQPSYLDPPKPPPVGRREPKL